MKTRLKQLFILSGLSFCIIVFYGCSVTNLAVYENNKLHIYDCKTQKVFNNRSDSSNVILFKNYYKDKLLLICLKMGC